MIKSVLTVLGLFVSSFLFSQQNIDVLHYKYEIRLSDKSDTISGTATIDIKFLTASDSVSLDLVTPERSGGKGMLVYTEHDIRHPFIAIVRGNKIILDLSDTAKAGEERQFIIHYFGVPADGLIISRSKFGKRTFFSDNWPNRARHWIPCVDDPADKASVEFLVTAPSHYEVVSNGVLVEEKKIADNKKLTHWKEDIPLPTKIMVIGVADFAIDTSGVVGNIPVTSWVFPENKKDGFYDYAQAKDILAWFIDYTGSYPFKKLANVQSRTIFGGMENASAIFYYENSVTGSRKNERLLAHEIAHQWFGDMVTEKTFSHIWLSEGFATCLANIYLESMYGTERMVTELEEDRLQAIAFAKTTAEPVVDTVSPVMLLLNANSYQKGGWVLHMLRRRLGDSVFHSIIRNFYSAYAGKNADTRDFQKVCEQTSGKDLGLFFQQWLFTAGNPELDIKWEYDAKKKSVVVTVSQLQAKIFQFPLEIELRTAGKPRFHTFDITKQKQQFNIPCNEKIKEIIADPHTSLLFSGTISQRN